MTKKQKATVLHWIKITTTLTDKERPRWKRFFNDTNNKKECEKLYFSVVSLHKILSDKLNSYTCPKCGDFMIRKETE